MRNKVINCTVLTPVLAHGPIIGEKDRRKAEIRVTEIRGLARYFYRGLSRAKDIKVLNEQEAEIFGSTNHASSVRLTLTHKKELEENLYTPVMHKYFKVTGIVPQSKFELKIATLREDKGFKNYANLIILALVLGGIGQRSRRARGAFDIAYEDIRVNAFDTDEFMKWLVELINQNDLISYEYALYGSQIKCKSENRGADYPYIEKIELGKRKYRDIDSLLKEIDKSCHEVNVDGGSVYTGFAKGKVRMGSTVYVSAVRLKDGIYPICTTVNPVFEDKSDERKADKREIFKQSFM